jgi:hypothetical protein
MTAVSIPVAIGLYERPGAQPEGGRGSQIHVGPPWVYALSLTPSQRAIASERECTPIFS